MPSKRGKPALKASAQGVQQAQKIFQQRGLTRQAVAKTLGIDRSVVGKFLRGEKIWSQKFQEICDYLEMPWQEIAAELNQPVDRQPTQIQTARDKVRHYLKVRCGTVRIPGMSESKKVDAIYTSLRILKGTLVPLPHNIDSLSQSLSGQQAVLDYPHLHILGLPGSGKTTFLKYLTIECLQGHVLDTYVPLFIALRDIVSDLQHHDLLSCICQVYCHQCGFEETELRQLFAEGRVFLLLDGEDEIPTDLAQSIALTSFDIFYRNRVVITCRSAASRYIYEQFTQATIQPLTDNQIQEFAQHWFESEATSAPSFLNWLNQIKAEFRYGIDLANTPLLLTLLCIVFSGKARSRLTKRYQIYEFAFKEILEDFNAGHIFPQASPLMRASYGQKITLIKAIAQTAFEYDEKIFPATEEFFETAGLDVEKRSGLSAHHFCRELETIYGLITQDAWNWYRFSHLSFHEYFMALVQLDKIRQEPDTALTRLLQEDQLFNQSWYEVFLFLAEMLTPTQQDEFLKAFKQALNQFLLGQNEAAQEQIRQGNAIAEQMLSLFTHAQSPKAAHQSISEHPIESSIIIRAFCIDYYYQFDASRLIGRMFQTGYQFNHDLVLAHCFKCNLNKREKQKISGKEILDFGNVLIYVWQQTKLHQQSQQMASIDEVRALFFDHVLEYPQGFSLECVNYFREELQTITELQQISRQAAIQHKSKLVAHISNPKSEANSFVGSEQYLFPKVAYQSDASIAGLKHYYHGCNLFCDCLLSIQDEQLKHQLLHGLFEVLS